MTTFVDGDREVFLDRILTLWLEYVCAVLSITVRSRTWDSGNEARSIIHSTFQS